MNKSVMNVPMYSSKGNQTIIEEIRDEYIRGGHDLRFVQQHERFYKDLEERLSLLTIYLIHLKSVTVRLLCILFKREQDSGFFQELIFR